MVEDSMFNFRCFYGNELVQGGVSVLQFSSLS